MSLFFLNKTFKRSAVGKALRITSSFLFFFVFVALRSTAQFHQVHLEANEDNDVRKISFYSKVEGYIAFKKFIGFTTDSGRTFVQKNITVNNVNFNGNNVNLTFGFEIQGVKAFDKNKIVVYGNYGLVPAILYSSDGGNAYKLVFYSQLNQVPNSSISDLVFPTDGLVGYAVDVDRILKTVDGGVTWTVSQTNNGQHFTNIQALSDNQIYVFSTYYPGGVVYSTTDGGNSWNLFLPNHNLKYIYYLNAAKVWLSTVDGEMYVSTNGGNNWTLQNDPQVSPYTFQKMVFNSDSVGYALGAAFEMYKTTDGGKLWERFHRNNNYTYLNYSLNDFQILGSSIWAGGGHGYLQLSANNGGITIPKPIFSIDTAGLSVTNKIKLINQTKPGYTYTWVVNNKIIGNTYNITYATDVYRGSDTVKLIAANAFYADTLTRITKSGMAVKIISVNPNEGSKGETVTINGENFVNVTDVSFGGTPAKSFIVSPYKTTINATIGNGTSGNVVVTTTKAKAIFPGFIFHLPPKITSFSPSAVAMGGKITLTGTDFFDINKISFGGSDVTSFHIISTTQIEATLSETVDFSGDIIIYTYRGNDTVHNLKVLPLITSLTVNKGSYGTQVGIAGTGFFRVLSVTLDGYPVKSFGPGSTNYNGQSLSVLIGEGSSEGKFVVTTLGGVASYTGFKFVKTPVIKSFFPITGAPGTVVTITGANFNPVSAENFVYFGAARADVTAATETTLTVTVPVGAIFHNLSVVCNKNFAFSSMPFVPTFKGFTPLNVGSFGALTHTSTIINARTLNVVDLNNDNKVELLVSTYTDAGAIGVICFNKGPVGIINYGDFSDVEIGQGDDYPGATCSTIEDWDMDGKLNIISAGLYNNHPMYTRTSSVGTDSVLHITGVNDRNQLPGSGSFIYDLEGAPKSIASSDLDGDGQIDYVIGGRSQMFPNASLADLDGDGRAEVLVKLKDTIAIYPNISTRGNIAYGKRINILAGAVISRIAAGDFDGDGKTDLAVTVQDPGGIIIFKNISTAGNISFSKSKIISATDNPTSIALSDLDGDNKIDMAVSQGAKTFLYKNTGVGIDFAPPVVLNLDGSFDLLIADMDSDGKPDIAGLDRQQVNIMRNLAGGPQITAFTPAGGPAGTLVNISGTGFTGTTRVSIGGVDVKSFTVNSTTNITAIAGDGAKGFIALDGPLGAGTSLNTFLFVPKPVVIALGKLAFNTGDSVRLNVSPANTAFKVQWIKNGIAIPGETQWIYTARTSGTYSVSITYGSSPTQTADPVTVRVLLTLPANNFAISETNVTCKGSNNGSITINARLPYNYTAIVTGNNIVKTVKFNSGSLVNGLAGGNYTICIGVDGFPDYQQCFTVNLTEPKDLSVYANIDKPGNVVELVLNGGDTYNIKLNDKVYNTTAGVITLPLAHGINKLSIGTDKLCQGVVEKLIDLSDAIIPYPNPVRNVLNINLGNTVVNSAAIFISSINGGRLLYKKEFINPYGLLQVDLTDFNYGVYLVRLILDNKESIYKITKQQ